MSIKMEDVVPTLTPTKVLVSILESIGKVEVPLHTFMDTNYDKRELQVNYDGDENKFIFSLKEIEVEDEQQ